VFHCCRPRRSYTITPDTLATESQFARKTFDTCFLTTIKNKNTKDRERKVFKPDEVLKRFETRGREPLVVCRRQDCVLFGIVKDGTKNSGKHNGPQRGRKTAAAFKQQLEQSVNGSRTHINMRMTNLLVLCWLTNHK
jgi:hypothetical protein